MKKALSEIKQTEQYLNTLNYKEIMNLKTRQYFQEAQEHEQQLQKEDKQEQTQQDIEKLIQLVREGQQDNIQQLENVEKLFDAIIGNPSTSVQQILNFFTIKQDDILNTNLKPKHFKDCYSPPNERQKMNPNIKKIASFFQTQAQQNSMTELMQLILKQLQTKTSTQITTSGQEQNDKQDIFAINENQGWQHLDRITRIFSKVNNLFSPATTSLKEIPLRLISQKSLGNRTMKQNQVSMKQIINKKKVKKNVMINI